MGFCTKLGRKLLPMVVCLMFFVMLRSSLFDDDDNYSDADHVLTGVVDEERQATLRYGNGPLASSKPFPMKDEDGRLCDPSTPRCEQCLCVSPNTS